MTIKSNLMLAAAGSVMVLATGMANAAPDAARSTRALPAVQKSQDINFSQPNTRGVIDPNESRPKTGGVVDPNDSQPKTRGVVDPNDLQSAVGGADNAPQLNAGAALTGNGLPAHTLRSELDNSKGSALHSLSAKPLGR